MDRTWQFATRTLAPSAQHADRTPIPAPRPGRLVVEYLGDFGPDTRHMDMLSVGTLISATGAITSVQVVGTDEPHAVVTLVGMTGESAQCVVDTEHYLDLWDFLVEGAHVQVSGKVRRPLNNEPAYIDTLTIHATADAGAQQAEAVNA